MGDDIDIILTYVLSLGDEGELPDMQADKSGSGDFAYEAALRLREDLTALRNGESVSWYEEA